jgi:hypothetical protein
MFWNKRKQLRQFQRHVKKTLKGKGKVLPKTDHEGTELEYKCSSTVSLTSAPYGVMINITARPLYLQQQE